MSTTACATCGRSRRKRSARSKATSSCCTSTARTGSRPRWPTSACGAAASQPGGTMLIHDSFSSVGVTLAILRALALGRRFRYVGRSGSMTEYRRELVAGCCPAPQRRRATRATPVVRPQPRPQGPDRRQAQEGPLAVLTHARSRMLVRFVAPCAPGSTRSSTRGRCRTVSERRDEAVPAVAEAPPRHAGELFEDHRAGHLRRAPHAVGERDRDLGDVLAVLGDPIRQLHLEQVAGGVGRLVVDVLERARLPRSEARGEVTGLEAEREPRVEVAVPGQEPAVPRPVRDVAARARSASRWPSPTSSLSAPTSGGMAAGSCDRSASICTMTS